MNCAKVQVPTLVLRFPKLREDLIKIMSVTCPESHSKPFKCQGLWVEAVAITMASLFCQESKNGRG